MSEIKIDKGIPVAPMPNGAGRMALYPFRQMEVGDSFFVPKTGQSITGPIAHAQSRMDAKFSRRTVTENGVTGTRVWRIA